MQITIPNTTIETITPEYADQLLRHPKNRNYRPLNKERAARFAEVMKRREWHLNGQSISLRPDGSISNGQTRLYACVLANMPFTTVVVRNVSDEEGMDDGAKRTFVDLLRNREETNINELSAAVGWLFRWEKGLLHTSGPGSLIPQAEYCRLLELHPKIREHVSYMGSVKSKIGNAGMLAMFRYVFSLSDPERAFTFFEQLASGANLDARSPTLKLRERFIRDKSDKASLLAHEKAALVIVAWKYFKTNKGCGTLEWYYKAKGETDLTLAEQFPKII